jgi:hypothetical protein
VGFVRRVCFGLVMMIVFSGCGKVEPTNRVLFDDSQIVTGDTSLLDEESTLLVKEETSEPEIPEEEVSDSFAISVKEKYLEWEKYDWAVAELNKDSVSPITFDCEKNIVNFNYNDAFDAFLDVDLEDEVFINISYDSEAGILEIVPSNGHLLKLMDESEVQSTGWGNISRLWLVNNLSLENGLALERPVIHYVEFVKDITAPEIVFGVDDKGYAQIEWESVSQASSYSVYEFNIGSGQEFSESVLYPIGTVDGVSFSDFQDRSQTGVDGGTILQNMGFGTQSSTVSRRGFCVVAVSGSGRSNVSNFLFTSDLSGLFPFSLESEYEINVLYVENVKEFPRSVGIVMCDGNVSQRDIDFSKATSVVDNSVDELRYVVTAPVFGTDFFVTMSVDAETEQDFRSDLGEFVSIASSLPGVGGRLLYDVDIVNSGSYPSWFSRLLRTDNSQVSDVSLNADSSLSHFIGLNMLVGNNVFDLSDFPEAGCPDILADAIDFAVVQNPLIGGVERVGYSGFSGEMYVEYVYSKTEQLTMQKNVVETIKGVVKEIVVEGMSVLEQEEAVNKYLCDVGEFDQKEFESMQNSKFLEVSDRGRDSLNAVGLLMNKIGIGSAYANAFKLFADVIGFKSVIVSGYLNGVPSLWNKVFLGSGDVDLLDIGPSSVDGVDWFSIDVCAGDNAFRPYSVFNVPDSEMSGVYFKDHKFTNLVGDGWENEIYTLSNIFVERDELDSFLLSSVEIGNNFFFRAKRSVDYSFIVGVLDGIVDDSFLIHEFLGVYFVDLGGE